MRRAHRELLLGAAFSALTGLLTRRLWISTNTGAPAPEKIALLPQSELATQAKRPSKVASYTIEAKLDARLHRISGHETIHFVNRSPATLNELWFHLYLNAFKNDKTLFLRSPFGAGRSGDRAREYGYVDVKRLTRVGGDGKDLWATRDRSSPGDPDDETDLRVPLDAPLEAGGTLELELAFEEQLPEIVERTGYSGSFHFMGQWFPKLARLEPSGRFAHFPFHAQSEFYADFGDYEVTIDVPEAFRVGATGTRLDERRALGRSLLRYRAEDVHDFAWSAWDQFQTATERIAGTDVTVLYPPHQERNAAAELASVRFALPHFNRLYGTYPYRTLTIVHPPDSAENAGGMEYPTLITSGGPWYSSLGVGHFIDVVTTHELGHQWFYGLVASNEHTAPFLDEGLNSYAEAESLEAQYGPGSVFRGLGLSVSSNAVNRLVSAARGADEAVAQGAADFASFRNLGALVYSRTAIALATLANVYGRDRLNRALGVYARQYRFEHPTPSDFMGVIQAQLGSEAARALNLALFERGSVDYLVRDISNARLSSAAGVFDGPAGRERKKQAASSTVRDYASRVVVYRHGSLELPVDVELTFEDGSKKRQHWSGQGYTLSVDNRGSSPIVAVEVDPEQRILLDDDRSNNWQSSRGPSTPRGLERGLYGAQLLLGAVAP